MVDSSRLILNRPGLPKKTQTYFFFQIDHARVHEFRIQLAHLVPLITTTNQVIEDQEKIAQHKKSAKDDKHLLKLSGVNIVFSQKGLAQVSLINRSRR